MLPTTAFISTAILFKVGFPPFHSWLLNIILISPYKTIILILFFQKFIPLHILSRVSFSGRLIFWVGVFTVLIIFLSLKNLTNIRTCLILSAWGNSLWMIFVSVYSSYWVIFLCFYGVFLSSTIVLLERFSINKLSSFVGLGLLIKAACVINFFNLAGLPPFTGFFAKLILLKLIVSVAPFSWVLLLLAAALGVLFAYLIIVYYVIRAPFSLSLVKFEMISPPILILITFFWLLLPTIFMVSP